jgi:hypothetical protein
MRLSGKFSTITRFGVLPSTLALALTCLQACAVPHVSSRVVYEDPTNFVRLEFDHRVLPDRLETRHAHPVAIGADEMAAILKGLSVRDYRLRVHIWISGEADFEPAFTEADIELLAEKLADALAKATPEERVTYYLSTPQTSVKRMITSGGLYMQGSELHFTLSNHREIYGIPAHGMVYDRRYPVLPIAPKDFEVYFDPGHAVVPRSFSLWDAIWGLEKDDVVIDLNKLRPAKSVALSPVD